MTRSMNASNVAFSPARSWPQSGAEVRGAVDLVDDPEEVLEPVLERPWVRLDVEEEVTRGRFWEQGEAPTYGTARLGVRRLRIDELEEDLTGRLAGQLDPSLVPDLLEGRLADRLDRRTWRARPQGAPRRHPRLDKVATLCPGDPRHERQVIVRPTLVRADAVPAADLAVLHRIRIRDRGRRAAEDPGLEARLDRPVVGRVVGDPVGMADAVAGDDVHRLRRDALELLQAIRIRAHLEEGRRLDPPGELRVGDLVAPVAEIAGAVDSEEEVRVATPSAVEEGCLEDHVATGAHRGNCLFLGRPELGRRLRVASLDLVDGAALRPERGEMRRLVLEAAPLDELQLWVVPDRPLDPTARGLELKGYEVVAGEVADEIRGTDDDRSVDELHAQTLPATRAS